MKTKNFDLKTFDVVELLDCQKNAIEGGYGGYGNGYKEGGCVTTIINIIGKN